MTRCATCLRRANRTRNACFAGQKLKEPIDDSEVLIGSFLSQDDNEGLHHLRADSLDAELRSRGLLKN
jgi:hypothetical protein